MENKPAKQHYTKNDRMSNKKVVYGALKQKGIKQGLGVL
jgi:hypothetical protein